MNQHSKLTVTDSNESSCSIWPNKPEPPGVGGCGPLGSFANVKPDFGSRGNGMPEAKRDDTAAARIARLEQTVALLIVWMHVYLGDESVKKLQDTLDLK
jgi:hypothetical protein